MGYRANRSRWIGLGLLVAGPMLTLASVSAAGAAQAVVANDAGDAAYAVAAKKAVGPEGALPTFSADSPANNLRVEFSGSGLRGAPLDNQAPWSFQLTPTSLSYGPSSYPRIQPSLTWTGAQVAYGFGRATFAYKNAADGLKQVLTIQAPKGMEYEEGKQVAIAVDFDFTANEGKVPLQVRQQHHNVTAMDR